MDVYIQYILFILLLEAAGWADGTDCPNPFDKKADYVAALKSVWLNASLDHTLPELNITEVLFGPPFSFKNIHTATEQLPVRLQYEFRAVRIQESGAAQKEFCTINIDEHFCANSKKYFYKYPLTGLHCYPNIGDNGQLIRNPSAGKSGEEKRKGGDGCCADGRSNTRPYPDGQAQNGVDCDGKSRGVGTGRKHNKINVGRSTKYKRKKRRRRKKKESTDGDGEVDITGGSLIPTSSEVQGGVDGDGEGEREHKKAHKRKKKRNKKRRKKKKKKRKRKMKRSEGSKEEAGGEREVDSEEGGSLTPTSGEVQIGVDGDGGEEREHKKAHKRRRKRNKKRGKKKKKKKKKKRKRKMKRSEGSKEETGGEGEVESEEGGSLITTSGEVHGGVDGDCGAEEQGAEKEHKRGHRRKMKRRNKKHSRKKTKNNKKSRRRRRRKKKKNRKKLETSSSA